MGQYFKPVVLDEDDNITHWMASHYYNDSTKLLDHSYLGNDFVQAFETLLVQEAPVRVVWAGDYAPAEKDADGNDRVIESEYYSAGSGPATLWHIARELGTQPYLPETPGFGIIERPTKRRRKNGSVVWRKSRDHSVFANAWPRVLVTTESHPYLINWDKQLFIDKRIVEAGVHGFRLHPLPLMTAEGNGQGGGDYFGDDPEHLIGSWARDHLSVSDRVLDRFTEIKFNLR